MDRLETIDEYVKYFISRMDEDNIFKDIYKEHEIDEEKFKELFEFRITLKSLELMDKYNSPIIQENEFSEIINLVIIECCLESLQDRGLITSIFDNETGEILYGVKEYPHDSCEYGLYDH
jgi:truncated hemoglobin YjbI